MLEEVYFNIFKKYHPNEKDNIEDILLELKNEGVSQIQCTRLLMSNLKLTIGDADKIVINSKAWKSHLDSVNNLRESFFNINFDEEE